MRRRDFVSAAVPAALAAVSCHKAATPLDRVSFAASPRIGSSPFFVALEQGFFREAGVAADYVIAEQPQQSLALAIGGKTDVLPRGFDVAAFNAIGKGARLRVVAGRSRASAACGNTGAIYGLRKNFPDGLQDLRRLKGKRIATGPVIGHSQFSLETHLESAGLSVENIIHVKLVAQQAIAALVGGSIHAAVLPDEIEHNARAVSEGFVHTAGLARFHPGMQHSWLLYSERLLTSHRDAGARFLTAYQRGVQSFVEGAIPQFLVDFARQHGLDLKQAAAACRDNYVLDGAIDGDSLQRLLGWGVRRGYIPTAPDLSQIVDDRFLRRTHAS